MCMYACLHEFICTTWMQDQWSQRVSDPLELESQAAMDCLLWVQGPEPWSPARAASIFNH